MFMLDRQSSRRDRLNNRPFPDYDFSMPLITPTEKHIRGAARRLADAAPGSEVILFGSHARGEAGPHSDVDFLVIVPDVENEAEESVRLRRLLRDQRFPMDIIVVTRKYAEEWRDVYGGVVQAALTEGRTLEG